MNRGESESQYSASKFSDEKRTERVKSGPAKS